jgi:hypothetical protein
MDKNSLVTLLEKEVKGLSSALEVEDYRNAIDDAVRETGYGLPVTNTTKLLWLKNRSKRHLFFYLLTESAHKFKVKTYSLNQRFDHYRSTVEYMDKKWEEYLASGDAFLVEDSIGVFGTKIDAGFQYETQTGRDTTYDTNNEVIHAPRDD